MRRIQTIVSRNKTALEDNMSVAPDTTTPAAPPEATAPVATTPAAPATEDITNVGEQTQGAVTETPGATVIEKEEPSSPGAQTLEPLETESPGAPEQVAAEGEGQLMFSTEELATIVGNVTTETIKQAIKLKAFKGNSPHTTPTATGLSGGPTKEKSMTVHQPEKPTEKKIPAGPKAKGSAALESEMTEPETGGHTEPVTEPAAAVATEGGKTTPTATGLSGGPTKEKAMTVTQPKKDETVKVPPPPKAKGIATEADDPAAVKPEGETTPEAVVEPAPAEATPPAVEPVAEPAPVAAEPAVTEATDPTVATGAEPVIPPTDPAEPAPAAVTDPVAPAVTDDGTTLPPEGNNGGDPADGGPGQTETTESGKEPAPAGSDVAPEFTPEPALAPVVPAAGETQADPAAADLTLEPGASIVEIEETDLTSNEDGLEDDIIALEPAEGEEAPIDIEAVEEAEEVEAALESMYMALESSLTSGGINAPFAKMTLVSMESLYDRVGYSKQSQNMVTALESMQPTEQSIANAQLAMEDIANSVKAIKDAIVKAIKKGIMAIKQFFGRVFLTAKKLQKRANAMVVKVGDTKGQPTDKVFTHNRIAKILSIDNKIPANLMGEVEYFTSLSKEVLTNTLSYGVGPMVQKFKAIMGSATEEEFYNHMEFKVNHKIFSMKADKSKIDFDAVLQDGYTALSSKPYFGNKILVGIVPEDSTSGKKLFEGLSNMEMSVSSYDTLKEEHDREIKVLSIEEATRVCKDVLSIATSIIEFEKELDRIMALLVKIGEEVNATRNMGERIGGFVGTVVAGTPGMQVGSIVGKSIGDAINRKTTPPVTLKARRLIYTLVNTCTEPAGVFVRDAMRVGNALLDYAEASTKLYHA